MRTLRNPERYVSPASAAAMLREIAADIERKPDFVQLYLNIWYATAAEVKTSLLKKAEKPQSIRKT